MWGEQGAARSAATLDSHIWRLRKLLEPERTPGSPPAVLLREPGGYRLVVAADQIDSLRYFAMAAEAGELLADGHAERALRCAEEAASLWRGRPYGRGGRPTVGPRGGRRLEEIRGSLRETHVGALLGTGAFDRALAELETALADEPLRERLWASRMIAYRALGRRLEALAAYTGARTALVEELGITWPTSCASSGPRLQGRCKARVVD
jgi:DNA-binding SARP family transcriptional activator